MGEVGQGGRHGYLYDSDAKKLARCFNVNIIIALNDIFKIRFEEDHSKAGKAKPYVIIHQSGAHFTTIHLAKQHLFSYDDILPIREWVDAA